MKLDYTERYIALHFGHPLRILSSAVYGGGLKLSDTIVNLHSEAEEVLAREPEELIADFLGERGFNRESVGLLTSADMEFAQFITDREGDLQVLAVVTAGDSNALNITERSGTPFSGEPIRYGTINTIVLTSACLLDECMASSIITATEAKTAALFDLKIRSVKTGSQATGTGTDSIVIVSGEGMAIQYAGGHTLYGQMLAETVYRGVKASLQKQKCEIDGLKEIERSFLI
jgi:iron complex transport system ATP-binding protein